MRVLNNNEIAGLLSFNEIVKAVEDAMRSFENKTSMAPKRMHIDYSSNTFICMPSFGERHIATKLMSVAPGNKENNMPVTNGVLLLNDINTGEPLSLMNAEKLTALRTGAVGALGIRYTTPESCETIGLIGCGVQGLHQVVFACSVRPVKKIFCLCRRQENMDKLVHFVSRYYPEIIITACDTVEELVSNSQIIIAATTSVSPVLPEDESLLERRHFVSVGSFKPSMQELPDAVYKLASVLVIDSEFAKPETGDIINPVKKGLLKEENVFPLSKLITGEKKIDTSSTTVFKSTGMAVFDLFVAEALYKAAEEKNCGTIVSL